MLYTNWLFWLWIVIALLVGAAVGFFLAQRQMKKYFQKNPPINEEVVRYNDDANGAYTISKTN